MDVKPKSDKMSEADSEAAKESIHAIEVNAALLGYDLGPFELVEILMGGYEARCGQLAWIGLT